MIHLKTVARHALVPLLYRYPPVGLQPERLQYYLRMIIEKEFVPGVVLEVGCNLAGTSIVARKMMRRLGSAKEYICVDTFGGFIAEQFATDSSLGTPQQLNDLFSANSVSLVRKILRQHDCGDIKLVQKDCTKLDSADLGGHPVSVCLLDVDLSEPIRLGLERIWPMVSPGGVILVDDCPESSDWKGRIGVEAFSKSSGVPVTYRFGLAILEKPLDS